MAHANIFDNDRIYFPEDQEMRVFGSTAKLSQWAHRRTGPAWVKIGRRRAYFGSDLSAYLTAQRVDPGEAA